MGDTDGEPPTVLIIDDEPDEADLYAEFLAEEYAARTEYSGEAGLEAVSSEVAVVLLDRRMPDMSGDEVLETIRARGIDCRVVMVTAVEPGIDVLELPFDDYLVKPVSGETIRDVVSRMVVRNRCDETIQNAVAIASRMATLESKLTIPELEASSEYASLEARLAELRGNPRLGDRDADVYTEFTAEKIRTLFG